MKVAHAAGAVPGDAVAARDLLAKVLAVPDDKLDDLVIAAKIDAENGLTNKGDWKPAVVRVYAPYATR